MNYLKLLSFLCCLSFLFPGCFEVREEVDMNRDGSGKFKLTINLSESKDQVKKYLTVEKVEGYELSKNKNVESILKHVKYAMLNVKGMSNVATTADFQNFIFTISSDFVNLDALNNAVTTVTKQLDYLYVPPIESKNYSYDAHQFNRYFDYPIDPKAYNEMPSMQRYVFESSHAISIFRFDRPIRSFSNKKAELSPSGKAIKLETSIGDLARGTETLENTISF